MRQIEGLGGRPKAAPTPDAGGLPVGADGNPPDVPRNPPGGTRDDYHRPLQGAGCVFGFNAFCGSSVTYLGFFVKRAIDCDLQSQQIENFIRPHNI